MEVWRGIRDLQYGRRGLVPTRVVAVDDEKAIHAVILLLNRRHFTTVLNVCSHFDLQELDFLEQGPVFKMIAPIPNKQ